MKYGTIKVKPDHRRFDYFKTLGSVGVPELPPSVNNDQGLWMPNQNAPEPIFGNPAYPEGCTDYGQSDMASNYLKKLCNPAYLESKTNANALGGLSIEASLSAVVKYGMQLKDKTIVFPFKQYFAVVAQATLDWFDAFRVCLFLGQGDRRTLSIGIPWMPEFEGAVMQADGSYSYSVGSKLQNGILPLPNAMALNVAMKEAGSLGAIHKIKHHIYRLFGAATPVISWHNAEISGYTSTDTKGNLIRAGEQFLKVKSWQGTGYGDNGWCYMSRPLANILFAIKGTYCGMGSPVAVPGIKAVDISWVQYVLSFVRMVANNYILRPMGNILYARKS